MEFVKSVAKWAGIWTLVVIGLLVVRDLRAGRALDIAPLLIFAVLVWVVMAGLVTFAKIMRGARRFGGSLGRAAVMNPKQDAGAAVNNAMEEALHASGVKKRQNQV